jgi:ribonuclease T
MLSLGACVVGALDQRFYVEIKPLNANSEPAAIGITGFTLEALAKTGTAPDAAMDDFARWISAVTPRGSRPVMVAYPVAFDWMFVAYYFHRFLGHNPFGITGLDLNSFHAGMTVRTAGMADLLGGLDALVAADRPLTHNALEDAVSQARLFEQLLARRGVEAGR